MRYTHKQKQAIRKAIASLYEYYLGNLTRVDWQGASFATRSGSGHVYHYHFKVEGNRVSVSGQGAYWAHGTTVAL